MNTTPSKRCGKNEHNISGNLRSRLCCFVLFVLFPSVVVSEDILVKTEPAQHRIRIALELKAIGTRPDVLVGELPLPESNEYQTIRRLETSPGKELAYPENGEKFLACRFVGAECPAPETSVTMFHEFEATLYDIAVDFTKIGTIYPYNKNSALYRRYTTKSGDLVDPGHPEIKRIAAQLATESKDPVEFARNAYVYVSDHYKYLNPYTGMAPLEQLLRNGGGDCGNLSSIFVSLLRNQGIPARHLVAVRPDGSYHVWADFYLEKYGWIPVDVTYRLQDKTKSRDYFGRVRVGTNGIILSRDVDVSVADCQGKAQKVTSMQTFAHWNWYKSSPIGKTECRLSVTVQPADER